MWRARWCCVLLGVGGRVEDELDEAIIDLMWADRKQKKNAHNVVRDELNLIMAMQVVGKDGGLLIDTICKERDGACASARRARSCLRAAAERACPRSRYGSTSVAVSARSRSPS